MMFTNYSRCYSNIFTVYINVVWDIYYEENNGTKPLAIELALKLIRVIGAVTQPVITVCVKRSLKEPKSQLSNPVTENAQKISFHLLIGSIQLANSESDYDTALTYYCVKQI